VDEEIRKIDRFTADDRSAIVEWPAAPLDPFFNVNTPDDLAHAERLLAESEPSSTGRACPAPGVKIEWMVPGASGAIAVLWSTPRQ